MFLLLLLLLPPANEVWGKVIFLHQFVILFTRGGVPDQVHPPGPGRYTPPGPGAGTLPRDQGQVHPPPRDQAGTPPRTRHPPPKQIPACGKRAGGTHPTGMLSCLKLNVHQSLNSNLVSFCFQTITECDRLTFPLKHDRWFMEAWSTRNYISLMLVNRRVELR